MTYLLDVNVLIALVDHAHINHHAAKKWFAREGSSEWATCPITENGVVRIFSHPKYPNGSASPGHVMALLSALTNSPGHRFWPDDISLRDATWVEATEISNARQITDTYLLALAASRGGVLATFDRRLSPKAVLRGAEWLRIVPV